MWTNNLNRRAAEFAVPEVRSEVLQLDDLASAYSEMDRLIADPNHQFGEQTIRDVHLLLSAHIPQSGGFRGTYYLGPRRIISAVPRDQILPFVEGEDKLPAMKQLGEDYGRYMQPVETPQPVETVRNAADVIMRMSDIHPFLDGNSRTARLLADGIFLRQGMHQIPLWGNDFKMGGIDPKAAFYRTVEMARRGNSLPLQVTLAQEQISASQAEIDAITMDYRIGEMQEAKSAVDTQAALIDKLSEFIGSTI